MSAPVPTRTVAVDLLEAVLRELVNLRSTFEPETDPEACEELDGLVAGVRQALEAPEEEAGS